MNETRRKFLEAAQLEAYAEPPKVLVVAVEMPSGAVETITNYGPNIPEKVVYYINAYDNDFRLKNNPAIRITGFMLV